jgi:hypothetical protein
LIFYSGGNLYGASAYGGSGNSKDTVFVLSPAANAD